MEKQKPRSALLVGATGLVGGYCLRFLLDKDVYSKVIILVRREISLKHPKLVQHVVDFDKLKESKSFLIAEDIFCCLGTTIKKAGSQAKFKKVDLEYPVEVAKISLENGAKQFLIVTAMGSNKSSPVFYNRVKGEVELAVKKLPFKSVHIFRPSLLLGERGENRVGEKIGTVLFNVTAPLFVGPFKKYKAIEGKAVGGAMVETAVKATPGVHIYESDKVQRIYDSSHR